MAGRSVQTDAGGCRERCRLQRAARAREVQRRLQAGVVVVVVDIVVIGFVVEIPPRFSETRDRNMKETYRGRSVSRFFSFITFDLSRPESHVDFRR